MNETKPAFTAKWAETGEMVAPSPTKYSTGYVAEIPTYQQFNYIINGIDTKFKYLAERGIAEWSNDIEYPVNAKVQLNGNDYYAKVASINITPVVGGSSTWGVGFGKESTQHGVAIGTLETDVDAVDARVTVAQVDILEAQVKNTQQDTTLTQHSSELIELASPKAVPHSNNGTLVAGNEINELRAAGTYLLPQANTVGAETTLTVALADHNRHLLPIVSVIGSDRILCSEGVDTSIQFDLEESVTLTFVSNGISQWRI